MVKVQKPKSVFGKHPYPKEQLLIFGAIDSVSNGVTWIAPDLVAGGVFFRPFPPEFRRKQAIKHLKRAKDTLRKLGV